LTRYHLEGSNSHAQTDCESWVITPVDRGGPCESSGNLSIQLEASCEALRPPEVDTEMYINSTEAYGISDKEFWLIGTSVGVHSNSSRKAIGDHKLCFGLSPPSRQVRRKKSVVHKSHWKYLCRSMVSHCNKCSCGSTGLKLLHCTNVVLSLKCRE
jgi:hypothetical protein